MHPSHHHRREHRINRDQTNPNYYLEHPRTLTPATNQPNFELRLIIIRDAERIDSKYGSDWFTNIFGEKSNPPDEAYRHPLLPTGLPKRLFAPHYKVDPPITISGQSKSFRLGRKLAAWVGEVNYCYSSPASRCVLTADAILRGMNHQHTPIRLEPVLFEPISGNKPGGLNSSNYPILSPADWQRAEFTIDSHYHPLAQQTNLKDNEMDYYRRCVMLLKCLEQSSNHQPRTVLIVGHSTTPKLIPTIAKQEPFDAPIFHLIRAKSKFLDTVVIEKLAGLKQWRQLLAYEPSV